MKFYLFVLLLISLNTMAMDANNIMQNLVWEKRVLLIFSPNSTDKDFQRQNEILSTVVPAMQERDIKTIYVIADGSFSIDATKQMKTTDSFYQRYAVSKNKFAVILVGKDSTVKLQKDEPVSAEVLFELIDSMPMRQYEMLQPD